MIEIADKEFIKLATYIKKYYGIDLRNKKGLVEGRLHGMLIKKGFTGYEDYLRYAFSEPSKEELKKIIARLTTNHTYFMREFEHFEFFKAAVLPYLTKTVKDYDLRIWSAGCSTGAEPYTLAMIIDEFLGEEKPKWDSKILATDISVDALEKAKAGVYTEDEVKDIPKLWLINYFDRLDKDRFEIKQKIKDEVIFRIFNLMEEKYPFKKKFHVIFCRNVMIYFDRDTRERMFERFYEQLQPGGYLFIGHSESIPRSQTKFKYVMASVYRKG